MSTINNTLISTRNNISGIYYKNTLIYTLHNALIYTINNTLISTINNTASDIYNKKYV